MSEQQITLGQWLAKSTAELNLVQIKSARLDCLLLLASVFSKDKSWVLAHTDQTISKDQLTKLQNFLNRRAKREPMAYILGTQEFYGLNFIVNKNVLIPRPETETLIFELLELPHKPGDSIIDIGTGSGAIAIAIKLNAPDLFVNAVDTSKDALNVAQQNASALKADINFCAQNLLVNDKKIYNFVVANLPYVDQNWQRSPETDFEPKQALFAKDDGLELIKILLSQTPEHLKKHGYILLEADPCQHQHIINFAKQFALKLVKNIDYCVILQKIS